VVEAGLGREEEVIEICRAEKERQDLESVDLQVGSDLHVNESLAVCEGGRYRMQRHWGLLQL